MFRFFPFVDITVVILAKFTNLARKSKLHLLINVLAQITYKHFLYLLRKCSRYTAMISLRKKESNNRIPLEPMKTWEKVQLLSEGDNLQSIADRCFK